MRNDDTGVYVGEHVSMEEDVWRLIIKWEEGIDSRVLAMYSMVNSACIYLSSYTQSTPRVMISHAISRWCIHIINSLTVLMYVVLLYVAYYVNYFPVSFFLFCSIIFHIWCDRIDLPRCSNWISCWPSWCSCLTSRLTCWTSLFSCCTLWIQCWAPWFSYWIHGYSIFFLLHLQRGLVVFVLFCFAIST